MALLTVLLLVPIDVIGAEQVEKRVPVVVNVQCEGDTVGQRIAFKVREGLRASMSMQSTPTYQESALQFTIVCLDPDNDEQSVVSRYSYAITAKNKDGYYDFLLNHGLGSCGNNRVASCAEGLVADIDAALEHLKETYARGEFKYKRE